jgi:hypothetical protein
VATRIKPDVLQILKDWKDGKPVRSLELGHVHSMIEHPGMSPRIDLSKRLELDQERAHEYCFAIMEFEKDDLDSDHETFLKVCQMIREKFTDVTPEEAAGAESLAWKALTIGWKRAIEGHGDGNYIEVSRPKVTK